jgi:two-component system, cell cycle sensor histidine kinase and response regulator CckA
MSAGRPVVGEQHSHPWRYARALAAPVLVWGLLAVALAEPVGSWLRGEDGYDEAALQEWLQESRGFRSTLPEIVETYLLRVHQDAELRRSPSRPEPHQEAALRLAQEQVRAAVAVERENIREHLESLGNPPTKMYAGQLPLFPIIYRLQVHFEGVPDGPVAPITWDSELPSHASQYQQLDYRIHPHAIVTVRYQLHAYNKRQRIEQEHSARVRRLGLLALAATLLGAVWALLLQRRAREQERQRASAREQVTVAERLLVREERRHAETESQLLKQRLATQAAERHALEMRSQLYANVGIMAGSYAHNIKNLLVRPNDLLRRCLEADGLSTDQETMLHEVRQTLGTVTERLQQILRTVRRDPSRSEPTLLNLNDVVRDLERTWKELARDKWKLELTLDLFDGPLPLTGDVSHLQQAAENLLFNARDATFEMRNHLRDAARKAEDANPGVRRQALIDAAAWRGRVILRTRRERDSLVLEVSDNGAGMSEEVRRRCTETHFSTKRDNAIHEGNSTGMGLGLSFVVAILEHHQAKLEIDSAPLQGTTFRVRFPALADEKVTA